MCNLIIIPSLPSVHIWCIVHLSCAIRGSYTRQLLFRKTCNIMIEHDQLLYCNDPSYPERVWSKGHTNTSGWNAIIDNSGVCKKPNATFVPCAYERPSGHTYVRTAHNYYSINVIWSRFCNLPWGQGSATLLTRPFLAHAWRGLRTRLASSHTYKFNPI